MNRELLCRGVLEPDKDGKASCSVRLPGLGTQRCYVVNTIPGAREEETIAACHIVQLQISSTQF